MSKLTAVLDRACLRKPFSVYEEEEADTDHGLERNLSLYDLLCIGIGGTVGSGVFVLSGLIAREYAGPGVIFSFLVAGVSCLFSAASYGELSTRIPSAGSSYAYAYVSLGEYMAVLAAWSLSLEYGISGSAVARSWGDKLVAWIAGFHGMEAWLPDPTEYNVNWFAGVLQIACCGLLLGGVSVGKLTVNAFTIMKIMLIFFMVAVGFSQWRTENLAPMLPFGIQGVARGATSCFFGYVGYDEVCCMAAEAKDPHTTLPRAVFGTILSVTVFYVLASLALVGMQSYEYISTDACFAEGFRYNGLPWAAEIVAIGELVLLPLVVLVSFLAQPRLMYAMAGDGLLPKVCRCTDF